MATVALGSLALAAATFLLLAFLVARRVQLAGQARRRRRAEEQLRPTALAIAYGDPVGLGAVAAWHSDGPLFAQLLAGYARLLSGDSKRRIAEFFEARGAVAAEARKLGGRTAWRRAAAAYTLGGMSSLRATQPLLRALVDDGDRSVRAAAARSLGRIGAVDAVPALVEALVSKRVPRAVGGQALLDLGEGAVEPLAALLGHDDPDVRATATELLGLLADANRADLLLGALRDYVRRRSARTRLGHSAGSAPPRQRRHSARALDDRIPFVREAAAWALGRLGDPAALPQLLELAESDAFEPARAAAEAAATIDPETVAVWGRRGGRRAAPARSGRPGGAVIGLVHGLAWLSLAYFAAVNAICLGLTVLAWHGVADHVRSRPFAAVDEMFASPLTPGISILLPAYNEEAGIVSERSTRCCGSATRSYEVVVVNDGSNDATMERLRDAFDLVEARKALRATIPTAPVRATYRSRRHRRARRVDKENGGKADALNAATMAARLPVRLLDRRRLVIEPDALLRVAKPFLDDPELVVATGGIVRIANGCTRRRRPRHRGGAAAQPARDRCRSSSTSAPSSSAASGWNTLDALLIISGAFGLFRRSVVEAAGGWWTRHGRRGHGARRPPAPPLRDRDEPYRLVFVPDPVCWTEAPETLGALSRQRKRWQRGLAETLGGTGGYRRQPALRRRSASRAAVLRRLRAARPAVRAAAATCSCRSSGASASSRRRSSSRSSCSACCSGS